MAYAQILRLLPKDTFHEYKADMRIVLLQPNGTERSVIDFKSGENPNSLRGFGVDFFVCDEAARILEESYISLWTTVTQKFGKGFFISTPKGRGWFYDIYQKGVKTFADGSPKYGPGESDPNPEWYSIRMATWHNPTVRRESIRDMKANLPEATFREEVAAEFQLESAGVFKGIRNCIRGVLQPYTPGHRYVMGVDLARLKDYTVLTVMDQTTRHVVYFERFNKIDWEVQYHKIIETARKYNAVAVMDSTGIGDPIVQTIQGAGVRVVPYKISGNIPKKQLIDKLRVNLEHGSISFPDTLRALRDELECYEYDVTDSGVVRYSAPQGKHDDCVISLALAVWVVDQEPWVYRHYSARGV